MNNLAIVQGGKYYLEIIWSFVIRSRKFTDKEGTFPG